MSDFLRCFFPRIQPEKSLADLTAKMFDEYLQEEANLFAARLKLMYGPKAAYRNGYRTRTLTTEFGKIQVHKPQFRYHSFETVLFSRYQRVSRSLSAAVANAYICGVSTRSMNSLYTGETARISPSAVSRITTRFTRDIDAFLTRPILDETPYVFCDATYVKVRNGGRYVSKALFTAYGINSEGERTILGVKLCSRESEEFWLTFFDELIARGLRGVQLVITDERSGVSDAVQKKFLGASWQICMVHLKRKVTGLIPKQMKPELKKELDLFLPAGSNGYDMLCQKLKALNCTEAAECLETCRDDALTYHAFPRDHWKKIYSTNCVESINARFKRRMRKIGAFPNDRAVLKLAGALLLDTGKRWQGKPCLNMTELKETEDEFIVTTFDSPVFA